MNVLNNAGCFAGPSRRHDWIMAGMAAAPMPAWQMKAHRLSPGFHEA